MDPNGPLPDDLRKAIRHVTACDMRLDAVIQCFEAAMLEGNLTAARNLRQSAHQHLELILDARSQSSALAAKLIGTNRG